MGMGPRRAGRPRVKGRDPRTELGRPVWAGPLPPQRPHAALEVRAVLRAEGPRGPWTPWRGGGRLGGAGGS